MQSLTLKRVLSDLNPTFQAIKENPDKENRDQCIEKLKTLVNAIYPHLRKNSSTSDTDAKENLNLLNKINYALVSINKTIHSMGFNEETIKAILLAFDKKKLLEITASRILEKTNSQSSLESLNNCLSQISLVIDNRVAELDISSIQEYELLQPHNQELLRKRYESSSGKIKKIKIISQEEKYLYWFSEKLKADHPFFEEILCTDESNLLELLIKHREENIEIKSLRDLVILIGTADLLGLKDLRKKYEDKISDILQKPIRKPLLKNKLLADLPILIICYKLELSFIFDRFEEFLNKNIETKCKNDANFFNGDLQNLFEAIYKLRPFSSLKLIKLKIGLKNYYEFYLPESYLKNYNLTMLDSADGGFCWIITRDAPEHVLLAMAPNKFLNLHISNLNCIDLMKVTTVAHNLKFGKSYEVILHEIDRKFRSASLKELIEAYEFALYNSPFFVPYSRKLWESKAKFSPLYVLIELLESTKNDLFKSSSLIKIIEQKVASLIKIAENNQFSVKQLKQSMPTIEERKEIYKKRKAFAEGDWSQKVLNSNVFIEAEIPDNFLKSALINAIKLNQMELIYAIASLIYLKFSLFHHPSTEKLLAEIALYPEINFEKIITEKKDLLDLYILRSKMLNIEKKVQSEEMAELLLKISDLFDPKESWLLLCNKAYQDYFNLIFSKLPSKWIRLRMVPYLKTTEENRIRFLKSNAQNVTTIHFVFPVSFIETYKEMIKSNIGAIKHENGSNFGICVKNQKTQNEYFELFRSWIEAPVVSTPDTAPHTPEI